MKKAWIGIVCLMLMLAVTAHAETEEGPWLGLWRLAVLEDENARMTAPEAGLEASFELMENGVCHMIGADGREEENEWAVTEEGIWVAGMPLTLEEDGTLLAVMGGLKMWFAKEEPPVIEGIVFDPFAPLFTPAGTATPPPAGQGAPDTPLFVPNTAPTPPPTLAPILLPTAPPTWTPTLAPQNVIGIKCVCTRAEMGGMAVDPSLLGGEYAVVLHRDGTAVLTLAGREIKNLHWEPEGMDYVVNYYGIPLRFTPAEEGLLFRYLDSLLLTLTPGA